MDYTWKLDAGKRVSLGDYDPRHTGGVDGIWPSSA